MQPRFCTFIRLSLYSLSEGRKSRGNTTFQEAAMVNLDQIREAIVTKLHKPFRVKELAEALVISESHLRDTCYQEYQMSPGLIIETVHLEIALELLADNRLKIYEICHLAGYQNLKTFRNAFKRRLNMTPKEFRKNSAKFNEKELMKILWGDRAEMFR